MTTLVPSTPENILAAASILRQGGLVGFPTETVYGLGANALDPESVQRIFAAKGRPADNPLIVHLPVFDEVERFVRSVPYPAVVLAEQFWPGPLTMVFARDPIIPDITTGGLETVAIRVPSHPTARRLLAAAEVPIAAPSANRSGRPSPTLAEHVWEDLAGWVDMIIDGGLVGIGVESTVLDVTVDPPMLLRPGGVTYEALCDVLGTVALADGVTGADVRHGPVRSPGMKYTHYAPQAPAFLIEGDPPALWEKVAEVATERRQAGHRVGILATEEGAGLYRSRVPEAVVVVSGSRADLNTVARGIFRGLRDLDHQGVDQILIEGVPATGVGLAIMNRLRKSAGHRLIQS